MVGALFRDSLTASRASEIKPSLSSAGRHDASGLLDIFQYLFAQGLRAGKLLLVAEAPEEYYFHFSGGQLLGKIEEVRFDCELVAVEGGADANVCDGPVDSWAEDGCGGVNAVFRQRFLLGGEIQSWHDEFASLACAGANLAFEGKRTAEEGLGIFDAAVAQSLANSGAGDD